MPVRKLKVTSWEDVGPLKRDWLWNDETHCLQNPDLGVLYEVHNVVYADTEEFHHRGVAICSKYIELHVILRLSDGALGFVYHFREKVIPPEVSEVQFGRDPTKPLTASVHATGITQWELPHGLAVKALAEAEEETGYKVVRAIHIGFVKESPPLGGPAHKLFLSIVDDTQPSDKKPEEGEQIMGFRFFSPQEVRQVMKETICALTLGGLAKFRVWGLELEEDLLPSLGLTKRVGNILQTSAAGI